MSNEMHVPLLLDELDTVDAVHVTPASSTVAILGSGDFSRSLAMRLVACGFGVVVGSRCVRRISPGLFPDAVELNSQEAAVAKAKSLVFMALFPEYYPSLLGLRSALAGKILVDVSNAVAMNSKQPSNAEQLAEMFPDSVVVKGFNTISAWSLQTGAQDGNKQVLLCSDSTEAKHEVGQLARRMGFYPVDVGGLCCAQNLERKPLHLFPSWRGPVLTTFLLFFFFYCYGFIRGILLPYLAYGQNSFYRIVLDLVNESLPCVALVSLALVYLPGLFAAWLQLWRGTKYQRFPRWLDAWLLRRKQLGLLSFLCAALHGVYSLCLPLRTITRRRLINAAFSQVKSGVEMPWDEQDVWRTDLYVSSGVLGLGILSLLAITSLPSVGNILTWREFTFIQSGLGYAALTLSVMHTLVLGWNFAFSSQSYAFYMPPSYMLAVALPCAVLVCRCFLLLPCVSAKLARIRRGWESTRKCPVSQHHRVQANRTVPQV
ncbi:metalloreductase STEAP3 [Ictalurus furcatus]|uniref:metalloreductase STEAP3 n=1 Tax=Ictalurus furcatus TaxID=66913 RepID=UPI002350D09B|nr:metalloreductase STEAP3 [Ictalurus furcatus]XP_053483162.1 metalloreductase STEAP3 [Ictalurus furcatus]XP_053483163.1 metalloreductase STEAP3 [Ictalurus furcatus]